MNPADGKRTGGAQRRSDRPRRARRDPAVGLGLRVGYAWDGRAPVYDAAAYAAIAANLERGEGFTVGAGATQPSSNYSPGLPLFVAGLYEVTGGAHERLARLVLALVGTLAVLFTYLIGRRLARSADPPHLGEVDRRSVVAGMLGALRWRSTRRSSSTGGC